MEKVWISCEDSLPSIQEGEDRSESVLVYTSSGAYFEAKYVNDSLVEGWRECKNFWRVEHVTHWMPLPDPPFSRR